MTIILVKQIHIFFKNKKLIFNQYRFICNIEINHRMGFIENSKKIIEEEEDESIGVN